MHLSSFVVFGFPLQHDDTSIFHQDDMNFHILHSKVLSLNLEISNLKLFDILSKPSQITTIKHRIKHNN